jgi:hypothetical protein
MQPGIGLSIVHGAVVRVLPGAFERRGNGRRVLSVDQGSDVR